MAVKFANLASTTLAGSLTNSATAVSVTDASSFPALAAGDYFYASIGDGSLSEIVKVTAVSSNTFTVVRGQDGTTARSYDSGASIALRVVAAALDDIASQAQTAADTESVSRDGDTMTGGLTLESTLLSKGHSSGDNWMPYIDGNFYIRSPLTIFDNNVRFADGSGNLEVSGDNSGNHYLNADSGQIRIRPNGATTNKIVLDSAYINAPAYQVAGATVIDSSREGSFATRASFGGIDSDGNNAASSNELVASGYGLMGNRGALYITNANAEGVIRFGIGGVHNATGTVALTITDTQINAGSSTIVSGPITSSGTITTSGSVIAVTAIVDNILAKSSGGNILFKTNAGASIARFNNNLSADFFGAITSSGNATFNNLTLTGSTDNLTFTEASGDWSITNAQQSNGLKIFDGASGVEINYNNAAIARFSSTGVHLGSSTATNSYGELQVNQTTNNDESGIAVLDATNARSMRFWCDTTTAYINSGNGGSGDLKFNQAVTVSSGGNLSGVGTLSSGAITSSGNISLNVADGFVYLNNVGTGNSGIYVRGITSSNTLRSHTTGAFTWEVLGSQKMSLSSGGRLDFHQFNVTPPTSSNATTGARLNLYPMGSGRDYTIGIENSNMWFNTDGGFKWYEDGNARMQMETGGHLNLSTGNLKINGTTVISSSRNITGIGTITSSHSQTDGFKITATDSTANAAFSAMKLDYNLSGADACTTDRNHIGLHLDIDSSASGGLTNHEHRIYGILSDVRASGDSDIVWGIQSTARVDDFGAGNQITQMGGSYGQSNAHNANGVVSMQMGGYHYALNNSSGTGQVTSTRGAYNIAYAASTSDYNNATYTASHNITQISAAQTANISSAVGVWGEIQLDNDAAADHDVTISNAFVFRAEYDENDGDDSHTVNVGYLYYGNYAGTKPTTAYGVYIADGVRNYFAGTLTAGLGSTTTASYGFNGDLNTGMYSPANHELGLLVNGVQKLKVDGNGIDVTGSVTASGNLLVGTTETDVGYTDSGAGCMLAPEGTLQLARSSSNANLYLNKLDNDGEIINFRKDGTTVGSIASVGGADIKVVFSSDADQYITGNAAANYLSFSSANAERMRLDASGNLLVGTTNVNPAANNVTGHALKAGGLVEHANSGAMVMRLNRTDSDGSIIEFRKGTSAVGQINARSGDLVIGTGTTGLQFYDVGNAIFPLSASGNTNRDAAIDLGEASNRFKDLYLSGNISCGNITASRITASVSSIFSGGLETNTSQSRVKISPWTGTTYGYGMKSGMTFGGLANNYALTFQMNSSTGRGFWWGMSTHSDAQGAMALTNDGKLTVNHSLRLGYGVNDTTTPGVTHALDVSGSISSTGDVQGSKFSDVLNPTGYFVQPSAVSYFHEIRVDDYIRHDGDTNTYMLFSPDRVRLVAGNVEMIDCVEGGTDYVDIVDRVRVTAGGDLECEGNITAYTTTSISDINQKQNIQIVENPIDKIKAISGYTFDWKESGEHSGGVIAQEIEQVMPDIVKEKSIRDGEKMKGVDYQAIIGLLVETVKDLNKRIEDLENGDH